MRKVGHMLKSAVGREEVLRAARAQRVLRMWGEIVGDSMAQRSYPDRYDRGTVWVAVQGSAWAQELRMSRDQILAKLHELSGEASLFKDLRFGVRPLPQPEVEAEAAPPADHESTKGMSIQEIAERRLRNWPGENRASK